MNIILQKEQSGEEIDSYKKEVRKVVRRLIRELEDERKRIASELHDDVVQYLSALKLSLDLIMDDALNEEQIEILNRSRLIAKNSIDQINKLSYYLRPPEIDLIGLPVAMEDLCFEYGRRNNLEIHYKAVNELPTDIPESIKLSLYRALQESLSAIANQKLATRINVHLNYIEKNIILSIKYNGQRLLEEETNSASDWNGNLSSLADRFLYLGGTIDFSTKKDIGNFLILSISSAFFK